MGCGPTIEHHDSFKANALRAKLTQLGSSFSSSVGRAMDLKDGRALANGKENFAEFELLKLTKLIQGQCSAN